MRRDDILRAIESLTSDLVGCQFSAKIVVTDNSNNADGIKEALANKFPQVLYIGAGKNVGFGQGNTLGFKAAPAKYYFALNPDTIILRNSQTIRRIIEFMNARPKIGCIGPKLLNLDGSLQYTCYRFDFWSIFIKPFKQLNWDKKFNWVKKYADRLIMKDFDHNETRPVDWVLGAAMVVRAEVVKDIGWLDKRYLVYLEDCDWCHTMWEAGWPVYYAHNIIIQHAHTRESAKIPGVINALFKNKAARVHLVSWFKYMLKWRGNYCRY